MPHFSKQVQEYLDEINTAGRKIERHFPKVWMIVQEWANQEIHPGAIAEVLAGTVPYFEKGKIEKPYAYLRGVMKTKKQNWREKDFLREHEDTKTFFTDLVERLKRVKL